jgi:hypothetical protein
MWGEDQLSYSQRQEWMMVCAQNFYTAQIRETDFASDCTDYAGANVFPVPSVSIA